MKQSGSPTLLTEDDVKCPICLYMLVEPVRMPCRHCLCRQCFDENITKTALQCPVCRARIGTFARRSLKTGTLVDEVLWDRIKTQFKDQLKLQKMNTLKRQKLAPHTIPGGSSSPGAAMSRPGEIRQEFEEQLQQMAQHHGPEATAAAAPVPPPTEEDDDDDDDSSLSDADEVAADGDGKTSSSRRLFQTICGNTSSSEAEGDGGAVGGRRRRARRPPNKENQSPAVFLKKQESIVIRPGKSQQFPGCTKKPVLSGSSPFDVSMDSGNDEDISFKEASASELERVKDGISKARAEKNAIKEQIAPGSVGKRGGHLQQAATDSSKTQSNVVRANKASALAVAAKKLSVKTATVSGKEIKHVKKVPTKSSTSNSLSAMTLTSSSANSLSAAGNKSAIVAAVGGNCSAGSSNTTSVGNKRKRYSSGYSSLSSTATVSPADGGSGSGSSTGGKRSKKSNMDELQQVALALMHELPLDEASTAALVQEQRALESLLKQEADDQKLAIRIQRQLTNIKVDRSHGSGEEYKLRSRAAATSTSSPGY